VKEKLKEEGRWKKEEKLKEDGRRKKLAFNQRLYRFNDVIQR
jgi:hypothetical protein